MVTRPWDPEGLRFKKYLGPILDALRALGGSGTPRQVRDEIVRQLNLPDEAVREERKSGKPRLQSQLSFAIIYLKDEGLIESSKRGVWSLTEKGKGTHLTTTDALAITAHWDEVYRKRRK